MLPMCVSYETLELLIFYYRPTFSVLTTGFLGSFLGNRIDNINGDSLLSPYFVMIGIDTLRANGHR